METTTQKNKKFLNFVYNFDETVKEENWIPRYDIESDALSFTVPKLSEDARIKYFDDEIAFYLTKDNNIEGIFIEYFGNNFIKHHKGFNDILKNIKQDDKVILELNKNKIDKIIPELENVIQIAVAKNIEIKSNL